MKNILNILSSSDWVPFLFGIGFGAFFTIMFAQWSTQGRVYDFQAQIRKLNYKIQYECAPSKPQEQLSLSQ